MIIILRDFCPQNIEYASTSVMVNAIAKYSGHKIWLTTLLNPFVWLGIKLIRFVQRAFDDDAYDLSLSNDFDGKYNVVSFEESIKDLYSFIFEAKDGIYIG